MHVHMHTHTHTEYYSTIKKNEIMCLVTPWIDLEDVILKYLSKERQILHDITYMWNLKKKKKSQIHRNRMEKTGCQGLSVWWRK